jgi:hypothetical protein
MGSVRGEGTRRCRVEEEKQGVRKEWEKRERKGKEKDKRG